MGYVYDDTDKDIARYYFKTGSYEFEALIFTSEDAKRNEWEKDAKWILQPYWKPDMLSSTLPLEFRVAGKTLDRKEFNEAHSNVLKFIRQEFSPQIIVRAQLPEKQ